MPDTIAKYSFSSPGVSGLIVYSLNVDIEVNGSSLLYQLYAVTFPVALTEKVWLSPSHLVTSMGFSVIVMDGLTTTTAGWLISVPTMQV